MSRYHGKRGVVYASRTGSGTASPVLSQSKWTLDQATDKTDVTAFLDANKVYVQGLKDLKGTISGWWDSADDTLFDAADSADGAKLYLYPSLDAPSFFWSGPAWLDAKIDVDVKGAVTVESTFTAAGSWARTP